MKSIKYKSLIIFIIIFSLIMILSNFTELIDFDEFNSYGFSFNIIKGLLPYRDYNMIIGPFYSLIMTIPIILFGNSLIMYEAFNAFIFSLIFTIIYNKVGNKTFILVLSFLICKNTFTYNNYCLFVVLSIILLLDSKIKYKNEIIGLLIGTIIITKHNIGGVLALIYFFTGKDKIKRTIIASIPVCVFLIYLIISNTLNNYLDLCIFGMGNFLSNLLIEPQCLLIIIAILYILIKEYIKTKDIRILYIIGYISIVFPIVDFNHCLFCIMPFMFYYLYIHKKKDNIYYIFKYTVIISIILKFVIFITSNQVFITNNRFLKYKFVSYENYEELGLLQNYYNNHKDGKLYIFGYTSYEFKLYNNLTLDFYDLINKGNLGKNEDKYVKDMIDYCKNNKCYFIIERSMNPSKDNHYIQFIMDFKYAVENEFNMVDQNKYYKVYESFGG